MAILDPRNILSQQNTLETATRSENPIAYRHQRVKQSPSQEIFLEGWLKRDRSGQ